jgi:hypothetical protein
MRGEMDGEGSLADGSLGTEVAHVGAGSVVRHNLGAEAAGGWISELVGVVEMASEGKAIGKSLDTQGALVDVWEVCLLVECPFKGVVGPVDAVGTGITAADSQGLRLIHALGKRGECDEGWSGCCDRRMRAVFILERGLRR